MDLVQALNSLSALGNQLSNEQLQEAQSVLNQFEIALGNLADLNQSIEAQSENELMQLIANYEIIKNKILGKF